MVRRINFGQEICLPRLFDAPRELVFEVMSKPFREGCSPVDRSEDRSRSTSDTEGHAPGRRRHMLRVGVGTMDNCGAATHGRVFRQEGHASPGLSIVSVWGWCGVLSLGCVRAK